MKSAGQRRAHFIEGGARPLYVLALMLAGAGGGGYLVQQVRYVPESQANAMTSMRNRYEDAMNAQRDRYDNLQDKYHEALEDCKPFDRGRNGDG